MTWRASVLTLVPGDVPWPARPFAGRQGAGEPASGRLDVIQIRDFATDRHHSVDDTPFGGGAGMVLRPDVVDAAVDHVADGRPLLCLTPRGRRFTQADAVRLAGGDGRDPVVRPLRRHRPARHRSPRHGGSQHRRLRAVGRRTGRAGPAGRHRPPAARRHGRGRQCRRGKFLARTAGIPALHPARRMARPPRAGRPAVRPSRRRRGLAPRTIRTNHPRTPPRSVGGSHRGTPIRHERTLA